MAESAVSLAEEERGSSRRWQKDRGFLEEALALARRNSFVALLILNHHGSMPPAELIALLGNNAQAFEAVSRLFLVGMIQFDDGILHPTNYGSQILVEFGLIDPEA